MKMKPILMWTAIFAAVLNAGAEEKTFASKSRWIWFEAPQVTVGDCYYRKTLDLGNEVKSLEIIAYMDDSGHCFFNGKHITGELAALGPDVKVKARKFVLTERVKPGENTLALKVTNRKLSGGLILLGKIVSSNGETEYFHSDKSWKASESAEQGWQRENFDDSDWLPAKEFMDVNAAPWAKVSMVQTVCRTPEEIAQDTGR